MSCTTIIAGRLATTDGSFFVARNEDISADEAKRLVFHPGNSLREGAAFRAFRNDFEWTVGRDALPYLSISDSATDGASEGEAGVNAAGVGMTATETIHASEAALAVDPYLPATGVIEDMLEDAVLPYIESAREGVLLLGSMIERNGAGEGFGVGFVDGKEAWWLEGCSGHEWVAARVPDDSFLVAANHARIGVVDLDDEGNFLHSPGLARTAEDGGLWERGRRPFNARAAYARADTAFERHYNFGRNKVLLEKYQPALRLRAEEDSTFPLFARPAKSLSLRDIASGLRNRYEGTDSDPYVTDNPATAFRPISLFRCTHSHILQLRPGLPTAVGAVTWVSWGMPSLGLLVPVFQGAKWFPKAYGLGTREADGESAAWIFRRPQTLAMMDYKAFEPIVRRSYDAWERDAERTVDLVASRYTALAARSENEASRYLQVKSGKLLESALARAKALECELMTLLTRKVSARFPFRGA